MTANFYGFSDDMFSDSQKIQFHGFKNGEHQFRVLPPFAPNQLFYKVDLHWGFTDENGRKKVLKCTKYSHKICPICDEVDRLTAELDMINKNPTGFSSNDEREMIIGEKQKRIGDIKRKPTYLWNIITSEGQAKVLQLSWNGHDPLYNKIKFLWETNKINVTDPKNSHMLWCSRTGTNAKTRYQYELVTNSTRALENLAPIIDLSKIYAEITPAELKTILQNGFVGNPDSDPNDRSFVADMTNAPSQPAYQAQQGNVPAQLATQQYGSQATMQANGVQHQSNVGQNVQQNAYPSNQQMQTNMHAAQTPTQPAPNVDDEIAKMQKLLQG